MEKERYFSVQLIDYYTFNFDYIGTRTTGNGGGHSAIRDVRLGTPQSKATTTCSNGLPVVGGHAHPQATLDASSGGGGRPEAAPWDLQACFQHHVERRGCRPPNAAEASRRDDLAQFRFASLCTQCRANFL